MNDLFEIRQETIEVAEVVRAVRAEDCGAVATFIGVVRDHNEGRSVTLLEYEAYQSMAEKQMRCIASELIAEHPRVRLAALHRVGALEVGDLAVVCAVASAHRGAAFDVCRQFIDRIKAEVPIWKREHGPEGPYWVGWEDARCHGHEHHQAAERQRDPSEPEG